MTLDSEQLRHAMRAWTTGVTVVTALHDGVQHGMTVNSFTSVSLEPPLVLISLQTKTRTHDLISKSGMFGMTILTDQQGGISDRFAGRSVDGDDRFAGVPTETLVSGAPLIKDGMAYLDCRVTQEVDLGANTLFIAEVMAARGEGEGQPLVYHNRSYWNLNRI